MMKKRSWGKMARANALAGILVLGGLVVPLKAQQTMEFRGNTVQQQPGNDATLIFHVENYFEITSGAGTIQWDPHVVDFVHAGDFGIMALSENSFSKGESGTLLFQWQTQDSDGNTLENGDILFSLTFNVRGSPGDSTSVVFDNGFTPLHFDSTVSINVPFSSTPGTINVIPEPSTAGLVTAGLLAGLALRRRRKRSSA